ncbi:MAG: hypothetical protein IAC78_01075 [Firmicutes bacterium]|uniref:SipW-cognate class signal peptide n=1 Tax=Candidatus Scatoplasma merdavium TaxID=2840932 RepID=A0A9D9D8W6_9BACL|nr:hypothetical protein [Candidatus Scatoplasma merdavium]
MKSKKNKLFVGGVALFGLAALATTSLAAFIITDISKIEGEGSIDVGGVEVTDKRVGITGTLAVKDTTLDLDGKVEGDAESFTDGEQTITMDGEFKGSFSVNLSLTATDASKWDKLESVTFTIKANEAGIFDYLQWTADSNVTGSDTTYNVTVPKASLSSVWTETSITKEQVFKLEWENKPLNWLNSNYSADFEGGVTYLNDAKSAINGTTFTVTAAINTVSE